MKRLNFCLAALCVAGVCGDITSVRAHHPGGVGNTGKSGPINTISASTLKQGQTVAGVTLNYTAFDELSDARLIAETESGNEGVHSLERLQSYALFTSFGLTNDLMVTLRLPYQLRDGIREAEDHHGHEAEVEDHGGTSGIGDLAALGQYRFLPITPGGMEAALLFGVKAPTGKTDERFEDELLDAEFQPGSGSWDFSLGLAATQRLGAFSLDANVLYTFVTEGTQQTDLGNQFLFNAALSYRLTGPSADGPMALGAHSHKQKDEREHSIALDLVLELNGEWQDEEDVAGVSDRNSNGTVVYLSPGARLAYQDWSGFVSVGIPVVTELNGVQPDPDWRLSAGTALSF